MPYRRRRSKRRRNDARIVNKAVKAVFKSMNNDRLVQQEIRGITGHVAAQKIQYAVACVEGSTFDFKNILTNAAGQDTLPTMAGDKHRIGQISGYTGKYTLRNMSPHAVYLTAYTLTPKRHIRWVSGTDASNAEHVIQRLVAGWQHKVSDAVDATIPNVTSGSLNFGDGTGTGGGSFVEIDSGILHPSHSDEFSHNYKIKEKRVYRMESGGTLVWKLKVPNFTFREDVWEGLTDVDQGGGVEETTAEPIKMIKNITQILMLRVHGDLGLDTAASPSLLSGLMSCHFAGMYKWQARPIEITTKDKTISMPVTVVDAGITDLEGPSERVMAADGH